MIEDLEIKLKLREKIEKTDEEKYDLLGIEDHLLDEEQIKKKRIQKMHKTSKVQRDIRKQR